MWGRFGGGIGLGSGTHTVERDLQRVAHAPETRAHALFPL
jgi:hypothetical protein